MSKETYYTVKRDLLYLLSKETYYSVKRDLRGSSGDWGCSGGGLGCAGVDATFWEVLM